MPKAGRLGDSCSGHACFPPSPIVAGSPDVSINGKPAARKGDAVMPHPCGCPGGHGVHGRSISAGSSNVSINGKPASRVGDAIGCGGSISAGSGNVFIGDTPYKGEEFDCGKDSAQEKSTFLKITPLAEAADAIWTCPPFIDEPIRKAVKEEEQAVELKSSGALSSAPEYVKKVAKFNNQSVEQVQSFYEGMKEIGVDYEPLIENAVSTHGLSSDEAHAVFGYTTKLFYRDLNATLDNGGSTEANELAELVKSGMNKMPDAAPTQFRGIRLNSSADESAFDSKFKLGNSVKSSFWSTAPNESDAYEGARNLVIQTNSAKDISDLAFGVHFHDKVGKPSYSCENVIPPGNNFTVVNSDSSGTIELVEM
ncbi:PAAR motif protein [Vibrio aerogenes CECT 7868]|uniref:PAAR motif protein n=1 Tax=Vibrio aerogenes CECT 7868 TaxID=1216006 RepID=A0A1M6FDG4_9VIBR|nr:PAAR domain-containing protein [Vibrio aerogenes]SHI95693.1 PAAR motif protein [Vibrio aerogenes CECT 7868]